MILCFFYFLWRVASKVIKQDKLRTRDGNGGISLRVLLSSDRLCKSITNHYVNNHRISP